jgi:hypothetical protein
MNNVTRTRQDFLKDLPKDLHSSCGWLLVLLLDKTEKKKHDCVPKMGF